MGRLIYLAATRPDLTYSIHVLSQFMNAPCEEHWLDALKVVRYLKGRMCDSDWGGCPLSKRSLTGWFVQFGESPISWRTQKHDSVFRSSAEAEYRAMAELNAELRGLKTLLLDFGISHDEPMTIMCDSKPAIHISNNPIFHERTKHVESDCHFLRDDIVRGIVKSFHVSTKEQLADILTKALGRKDFEEFLLKLGILG